MQISAGAALGGARRGRGAETGPGLNSPARSVTDPGPPPMRADPSQVALENAPPFSPPLRARPPHVSCSQ